MIIKMNSVDCLIGLVLFQLIILLGWFYFINIFGLFCCDVLKRRGESSVMEGITGYVSCFIMPLF